MEKIGLVDPLKDSRWDAFVESHLMGWVCHLSGWKSVLEQSFKHMKGYYFAVVDDSDGNIRAGLPVFHVKSWLTGNRLVGAPFATLFDPLVSNHEEMRLLLEEILKLSHELNCSYVEIRSFHADFLLRDDNLGESRYFKHHYLKLDGPLDKLRSGFHRTCVRQRISRAEKSDIQLKVGQQESDLLDFYKLQLLTRKRLGLPSQPYQFFRALWKVFHSAKQMHLLLAQKDGKSIASLLLFQFKERLSAEFAASDETFKDFSPNHFLFWEAIKRAYGMGCKVFDFGRTSPENASLMDFKGRWGTEVVDLPVFYYPASVAEEMGSKEESWKYKVASKLCKDAPDGLQKVVGGFIYRHLG